MRCLFHEADKQNMQMWVADGSNESSWHAGVETRLICGNIHLRTSFIRSWMCMTDSLATIATFCCPLSGMFFTQQFCVFFIRFYVSGYVFCDPLNRERGIERKHFFRWKRWFCNWKWHIGLCDEILLHFRAGLRLSLPLAGQKMEEWCLSITRCLCGSGHSKCLFPVGAHAAHSNKIHTRPWGWDGGVWRGTV